MNKIAAIAPPAPTSAAACAPGHAGPVDRHAWAEALRAYELAADADAKFDAIFLPIDRQRSDEIKALGLRELPADRYIGNYGGPDIFPAERVRRILSSRRDVEEWDAGKVHVEEYVREEYERHIAACREVVEIDDAHRAAVAAIDERLHYQELSDRWERLGDELHEAELKVLATPAPDGAALLWKLGRILEGERQLDFDEQIMADARRLLSVGRA